MDKWNKEHIDFLKNHYADKGQKWCAFELGCSLSRVRYKASSLGLKLDRKGECRLNGNLKNALNRTGKKRPTQSKTMKEKALRGELHFQVTGKHPGLKHGLSRTKMYRIWKGMIRRCTDPSADSYKYYGAKGVQVCKEWLDIENFKNWWEENYIEGLTIDRINSKDNYYPQNCRFLSLENQARNKSNNVLNKERVIEIRKQFQSGEKQADIARAMKLDPRIINNVVHFKRWNNIEVL